jgi:hypothetical protein
MERRLILRAVFWISIFSFIWITSLSEPCPAGVSPPDSPFETPPHETSNGTFQVAITKIPSQPSAPEEPVEMIADPLSLSIVFSSVSMTNSISGSLNLWQPAIRRSCLKMFGLGSKFLFQPDHPDPSGQLHASGKF